MSINKNLKKWALIAEIIGAFAVVISLVYVGMQVNDNSRAVRSASAHDANAAMQTWYLSIGSNQQTSELFYRALTSEVPLSNEEEFQFLMMMHGNFLGFQDNYLLAQEGTIDDELLESLTMSMSAVRYLPGMERYWRQRRSYLHAGFADWVDQLAERETDITVDIYQLPRSESKQE